MLTGSTTERGLYPAVEFQLARLCLCPGAAVIVNPHGYESSKRKLTAVVVVTLPELSTLSHLMNTGNIFELDDKERLDLMIGMNGRFLRRVTQDFERVVKLYSQVRHPYVDRMISGVVDFQTCLDQETEYSTKDVCVSIGRMNRELFGVVRL